MQVYAETMILLSHVKLRHATFVMHVGQCHDRQNTSPSHPSVMYQPQSNTNIVTHIQIKASLRTEPQVREFPGKDLSQQQFLSD